MISYLVYGIIVKIILVAMLIGIYLYRDAISVFFTRDPTKPGKKIDFYFRWMIDSCNISYKNWFTSIALPIMLVGLYWYYLISHHAPIVKIDSGILHIVDSAILSPLWEEIIFRGILLGLTILLLTKIMYNKLHVKKTRFFEYGLYFVAVGIISIIFSFFHESKIDLRYVAGIIFGLVYIADRKNLLPAIIAHTLNNVILLCFFAN